MKEHLDLVLYPPQNLAGGSEPTRSPQLTLLRTLSGSTPRLRAGYPLWGRSRVPMVARRLLRSRDRTRDVAQRYLWMSARIGAITLALLAACPATSAQPFVEELLRSEVVYPQEDRALQVTASSGWEPRGGSLRTPISVEYGLNSVWQVGMRIDGVRAGSRSAEFGVRRSFMNFRGSGFHFAVGLEAESEDNAGAEDEGQASDGRDDGRSRLQYGPSMIIAKDVFRNRGQIFGQFNIGLPAAGGPSERRYAAGGLMRTGPIVLTSEFTWAASGLPALGTEIYWTPGLVWRLPVEETWEVAGGISIGLAGHAEPFCLILKVTHEFENVRRLFGR